MDPLDAYTTEQLHAELARRFANTLFICVGPIAGGEAETHSAIYYSGGVVQSVGLAHFAVRYMSNLALPRRGETA